MLKNASLRSKLLMGFGLLLMLMLLSAGVTIYQFNHVDDATNEIVKDAIPLGQMAEQLLTELINEETGVRGYLATGNTNFLEPYNNGKQNIQKIYQDLEPFYAKHPIMASLIKDEAKPKIQAIEAFNANLIALVGSGKIEEARARAGDGKQLMDAYRGTHEKVRADIKKLTNDSWDDAKGASSKAKWLIGGLFIISLLLGVIIALVLTRSIAARLAYVVSLLEEVSQGNLAIGKVKIQSNDEIGKLGLALESTVTNLRDIIRKVSQSSEHVAASSEELTASAEQSAQAANQVASSITTVAAGATEQMNAANETSAVIQQMASGIQQMAANANQVAAQSAQATDTAKDGGRAVEKAVTQMAQIADTVNTSARVVTKLGERSKEIGQIVDTISGIAGQTNLLALNAAIEAARAGEQGRGFAVVAEEVRKLAEQSQEAAKKIADLIGEIQGDTDKAVTAMNDGTREVKMGAEVVDAAGAAFRDIVDLVTQVSGQVKDISVAVQQMANGSQQIVSAVKKIDDLSKNSASESQGVSAITEEQLASMEEIASSSQALARLSQELQTAVARFRL